MRFMMSLVATTLRGNVSSTLLRPPACAKTRPKAKFAESTGQCLEVRNPECPARNLLSALVLPSPPETPK